MEGPRGFLARLIVGGGIGSLLGVLFAPESGEGTRGRVRDRGQRLTEEEAEKIVALDAGAGDFLTNPFGIEELLTRLRVCAMRAR